MIDWLNFFFSFRGRFNRARYWGTTVVLYLAVVATVLLMHAADVLFSAMSIARLLKYIILNPTDVTMDPFEYIDFITSAGDIALIVLFSVILLSMFVSVLAVMVKRLHDRGKSWHWIWPLYFAPLLLEKIGENLAGQYGERSAGIIILSLLTIGLSLWSVIEFGILKGTEGPNTYGDDPLSPTNLAAATSN